MKDLYEIFGIPRDCDQDLIRRAYQSLACFKHPDKPTGSTKEFQELKEAYTILRDPDKRARYDRGESTDDKTPIEQTATARLGALFQQAIITADDHKDLIDAIRTSVANKSMELQNNIDQINESISKFKHVLDRVEYKGDKNNIFAGQIELSISGMEHQISVFSDEIKIFKVVLVMLNDYECEVKEKEVSFMSSTATASDIIGSRFYSGYRT